MVWRGVAKQGKAWQARQGGARNGRAVLGTAGVAWMGPARYVEVWPGKAGMARRGKMATGIDPWQPGKTGNILTTPKGTIS